MHVDERPALKHCLRFFENILVDDCRPLYKDGDIIGITALMTDITERKQLEQKLEEMATHDSLRGCQTGYCCSTVSP